MATLTINGDNSSYTIELSGMSTSTRYHVFVADISSTGTVNGYYCRRSSLGSLTTWSYSGSSSSPYSEYDRPVMVRTSTSATSHVVGQYYSYEDAIAGTSFYDYQYIPAKKIQNYYGLTLSGQNNGVSSFTGYVVSKGSGTSASYSRYSSTTTTSGDKFYISDVSPDSGYAYPIIATPASGTAWTVKTDANTWNDHYVSFSSTAGEYRGVTLSASEIIYYYYKKTYSANGGYYNNDPSDTGYHRVLTNPTSISIELGSSYRPIRSGYYFRGYYIYMDGTYLGSTTTSEDTFTVTFSKTGSASNPISIDLYARWEEIPTYTYTLQFNANRGSGAPSPITYGPTTSTSVGLTIPTETPTRAGYAFKGWATSSTATTASYQPGGTYWMTSDDTSDILYAVWAQLYYGRVVYNLEGGSMMGSVAPYYYGPTQSREGSGTYNDTVIGITPTKQNNLFLYWGSTASILAADKWKPRDPITINCNSTDENSPTNKMIHAVWEDKTPTYYGRIRYLGNGGTPATSYGTTLPGQPPIWTISSVYVKDTIKSGGPTRTGYTFLGWATSSTATKAEYEAGDDFDVLCASLDSSTPTEIQNTLYAVWQLSTFTLTLDGNGGTFGPYLPTKPVSAKYGEVIHLSEHKPTRDGYILLGWNPDQSATTALYGPDEDYTMTYINLYWYAIWQKKSIDEFNWTSADGTNIVTGQPVANILASKWNLLRGIIETISGTKPGTDVISQVTPMTKTIFNTVRNAIAALPGASSVPSTVDTGDPIEAELFHTTNPLGSSLKKAVNKAIDYYNTH